jgi:ribosomal protein S18 acetylase RimI-like enzyme
LAQICLRRAGPGDEMTLALVGAATFLDAFVFDIAGPDLIAHCQSQHSAKAYSNYLTDTDPRTACWIAEIAATQAPVGYALTCPPDLPGNPGPDDVELKRIYCLSRLHGSGAGQALMDQVLDHASACRAPRLWLGTYAENHRAVAFYKRNHFVTVTTRQFQVGNQLFDDIVMARQMLTVSPL